MDKTELKKLQIEIKNKKNEIDKFYTKSLTRLTDLLKEIVSKLDEITIRYNKLIQRGIEKSNRENFHTNISSTNQIENELESLVLEYNFLEESKKINETKIEEMGIKVGNFNNICNHFNQDEKEDLYGIDHILDLELESIKQNYNGLYNFYVNNGNSYNTTHHQRAAFGSISNHGGYLNKSKHNDMSIKDIKELCKANQIKLSKKVNDKTVVYTKKELITKLKRKKLL